MRARSVDRRSTLPELCRRHPAGAQRKPFDLRFAIPAAIAAAGVALLLYEIVSR